MGWLFKRDESDAQNENFLRLIRVAQEDEKVRAELISILSLDSRNRMSALNRFIADLKLTQSPSELIASITLFLDEQVARRALALLKEENR